jgi:hypothetical protein
LHDVTPNGIKPIVVGELQRAAITGFIHFDRLAWTRHGCDGFGADFCDRAGQGAGLDLVLAIQK